MVPEMLYAITSSSRRSCRDGIRSNNLMHASDQRAYPSCGLGRKGSPDDRRETDPRKPVETHERTGHPGLCLPDKGEHARAFAQALPRRECGCARRCLADDRVTTASRPSNGPSEARLHLRLAWKRQEADAALAGAPRLNTDKANRLPARIRAHRLSRVDTKHAEPKSTFGRKTRNAPLRGRPRLRV